MISLRFLDGISRPVLMARRQRHRLVGRSQEELAVAYLSAAPGPIRRHYRQKINAMVYQAIIE
jgi:hypothetical protein